MLPDIDLRLHTLATTLRDIVLPVIPAGEGFAREQVQLMMAHVAIIEAQWKRALAFERQTFDALRALAVEVHRAIDDASLRTAIEDALIAAETVARDDYDAVNRAQLALAALIDRAIAAHRPGARMAPPLAAALLDYGKREAWRYRVWFQGAGIDPDGASLPEIDRLFD